LLGDWQPAGVADVQPGPVENGVTHIAKDSAQTHIGLAHEAAGLDDPGYYAARVAQMVLSGGMASRLFTEVREKRGLVYHVSARYHAIRHKAGLFTYAGTEPGKAQETFDVTVAELRRLAQGIEPEEIDRAHVQARSSLVMQGESTAARAASMASDYRHLGRPRSLEEISEAIEAVTLDEVMDYLRAFPAEGFTILTIGPEPIDTAAAEANA
jgi:predicted Zn-dependent peptidase